MTIALDYFLVSALVVVLTGISKSGFAGGLSVIAVPAMSLYVSPQLAAAIMLPILCVIDLAAVWRYRRDWSRRLVLMLVPGMLIGIVIGAVSFRSLEPAALKIGVGVLALWFVFAGTLGNRRGNDQGSGRDRDLESDHESDQESDQECDRNSDWDSNCSSNRSHDRNSHRYYKQGTNRRNSWLAAVCGGVAGFTSFVAHAGGPPVKGFLLTQSLDKTAFVGTNSYFFFVMNQIKLFTYLGIGQFSTASLSMSLWLAPMIPVGVWIGFRLHDRVDQQTFVRIAYAFLALAGAKLLWDGIRFYVAA